jgi:antitoxin HicB
MLSAVKKMSENRNTGSSFDDFLKEEGIYEQCTATALKRVLAWQVEQEMRRQKITKSAMAVRMKTSRSQLDRLLDPEKTGVSLETMQRAAAVVGRELRVELV